MVSVAPAFASRWLVPRLGRFYALDPGFALRMDATTRVVDLNRSDVDLAIRMGDGHWPGAKAELLLALEIFPVCAPANARRLKTIADLKNEWSISDDNSLFTWDRWFAAAGVPPVALLPGARFTDPMLCLEAAIGGQGVMLAWQLLVADALADGRLVAPFGVSARSGLGYYFATAARAAPEPKGPRVQALDRCRSRQDRGGIRIAGDRRAGVRGAGFRINVCRCVYAARRRERRTNRPRFCGKKCA